MNKNDSTNFSESREADLFSEDALTVSKAPKKRSVRKTLLIIVGTLCLILVAVLGVLFWGMHSSTAKYEEVNELESTQYEQYTAVIENTSVPEGWDASVFEQLKTAALNSYDTTVLSLIDQAQQGDENAKVKLADMSSASEQPLADQYKAFFETIDQYPAAMGTLVLNDPSLLTFALNYPANAQSTGNDVDLTVESFETIPELKTFDENWGYVAYGNGTIADSGSAPTALAAVMSYLLNDAAITPLRVAQFAQQYGYDFTPISENDSLFGAAALTWGVNMTPVSPYEGTIDNSLASGGNVILVTGSQENPQFLILKGIDESGNWVLYNPSTTQGDYSAVPSEVASTLVAAYSLW